ncbi:MAG: glutamine synthetase III [Clostridia bacterium]|nr:glutamine synthetase III [Clostridia bacterium]MBR6742109.1 glutamine synthetase III [Clostridia bacterium]
MDKTIPELFGSLVFNDKVMRERLSVETYAALKKSVEDGVELGLSVANEVASAMKDWALEKGATHFTHWFQPMTGITAEKHDSFITPQSDGTVIMEFSGKELIKGEPDASSFPSGGLRSTFEARGYTAWDPSSHAFIKDKSLCIPTVFCSHGGEALDNKTPLLKSVEAVSREAIRILRAFGNTEARRVIPMVGAEQEYFLVDRECYEKRRDLKYAGRVLFGAKPPKGQEMDDHYFGSIKPRISQYMHDLDMELWQLGVYSKTKHNEAAPAQHELAPVFSDVNTAVDHNQLTMEAMKRVARRHGLVCLLHEKPFNGINGSGKHNNWSLCTDKGENLLNPGKVPAENIQFLLFFAAVIRAVDEYQDLLRVSVSTAGNDHRLGGDEAPPAIVSMFIGDELTAILTAIENEESYRKADASYLPIGVHSMPKISKDTTDRNRTSPFAFTGNKFEFRMPGSSMSISSPNTILNTVVAEELSVFADRLEAAEDKRTEALQLIRETVKAHKRIIFNGDNYTEEWQAEARARGLANLKTTVDALPCMVSEKSIRVFSKHGVFSEIELKSRYEILLETYCKTLNIEVLTMLEMSSRDVYPAISKYTGEFAKRLNARRDAEGRTPVSARAELEALSALEDKFYTKLSELKELNNEAQKMKNDIYKLACFYCDKVIPAMNELRAVADECEMHIPQTSWPYPSIGDMIFKKV